MGISQSSMNTWREALKCGDFNRFKRYCDEYEFKEYACQYALIYGEVECFKYAYNNGCKFHPSFIVVAARYNTSLKCLKYCYENLNYDWAEELKYYDLSIYDHECVEYISGTMFFR